MGSDAVLSSASANGVQRELGELRHCSLYLTLVGPSPAGRPQYTQPTPNCHTCYCTGRQRSALLSERHNSGGARQNSALLSNGAAR